MKILLIDNYDSFTYNLFHYISKIKKNVEVIRNDKIDGKTILKKNMIRLLYLQVQEILTKLVIVLKL